MTFPWLVGLALLAIAGLGCFAIVIAVRAAWRQRRPAVIALALALVAAGGAQLGQLNATTGPVVGGAVSVVSLLAATVAFLLVAYVVSTGPGGGRPATDPASADRR